MEEDIDEIRALRMNAMDYNADEDVSYVVDAGIYFAILFHFKCYLPKYLLHTLDALNKVQSNVSEATVSIINASNYYYIFN